MKNLIIDIGGKFNTRPIVTIDGEQVDYEKRDGEYKIYYSTQKDKVTVTLTKYFEINSKNWIWLYLLYFLISVFGLFDTRMDNKCMAYNITLEVDLLHPYNVLSVILHNPKKAIIAAEFECNTRFVTLANSFYVDEKAKKRTRIYNIIKLAVWTLIIALLVILRFAK